MVNPTGNNNPIIPQSDLGLGGTGTNQFSGTVFGDSLGTFLSELSTDLTLLSANSPQLPPGTAQINFMQEISAAIANLNQTLHANEIDTDQSSIPLFEAVLSQNISPFLANLFNTYSLIAAENAVAAADIVTTTQNAAIDGYNSEVSAQVNTINTAIAQYNAGTITKNQFDAAMSTWNSFAQNNPAATTYNSAINGISPNADQANALINSYNATANQTGLPTLPNIPSPPTPPSSFPTIPSDNTPVSSIPVPTPLPDQTSLSSSPVAAAIIDQSALINFTLSLVQSTFTTYQYISAYQDFQRFYLGSTLTLLFPDAYISVPRVTVFGGGLGGGAGISDFIPFNDSPLTVSALALNDFLSNMGGIQNAMLLEVLQSSLSSALGSAIFPSITAALALLSPRLAVLNPESQAIDAAIGLAVASNLLSLVESNPDQSQFLGLLQGSLGDILLSNDVVAQLQAGFNVALLGLALTVLSTSLDLPGLAPQVFGNIPGVSQLAIASALAGGLTLASFISNPVSLALLSGPLTNALALLAGFSSEQAYSAIAQALGNAFGGLGSGATATQVQGALQQALVRAGIDPQTAQTLANLSTVLIAAETAGILNVALNAENIDQQELATSLTVALNAQGIIVNQQQISDAINAVSQENINNNRDLRDSLAVSLIDSLGVVQAFEAANQAIGLLLGQQVSQNSINNALLQATVTSALWGIGNASSIAAAAIAATLGEGTFATQSQFRLALSANLIGLGVSEAAAFDAAFAASIQNSQPNNPLLTANPLTVLPPDQLANAIRTQVVATLGSELGVALATNIANRIATFVVGATEGNIALTAELQNPVSLLNVLSRELDQYLSGKTQATKQEREQAFIDAFITPSLDMFAYLNAVLDPANRGFLTMASITQPGDATTPRALLNMI